MFRRLKPIISIAGVMVVSLLVGCQAGESVKPVPVAETVERQAEVQVPAGPGALFVYSGRAERLVAPIIEMFTQVSGIDVKVRYGKNPKLVDVLLKEGPDSPADVFFAADPSELGAVANAGMMAALPDEILAMVDPRFRSMHGQWVGVSGRARVVVYNTQRVSPGDLPKDLWGFTHSDWNGRIGWAPENGSFQTFVTAARRVWGEDRARDWLQAVQANNPKVYPKNSAIVAATAGDEIDVGLVNHYYLHRFLQEHGDAFPARNHLLPLDGTGSLVMMTGVARIRSGPDEVNAHKFIEFLLSPVAQQYFASQTFEYPTVEGVRTQRGMIPLAELNAHPIELGDLADLNGTRRLLREMGLLQ